MSQIPAKNTKPELAVRRKLHALGYRYQLHRKDLPGKPDIVLPKYRTVIFVNGCFWHQHHNCKKSKLPKTNYEYWRNKLNNNLERDKRINQQLASSGWRIITLWECELEKNPQNILDMVDKQLRSYLEN